MYTDFIFAVINSQQSPFILTKSKAASFNWENCMQANAKKTVIKCEMGRGGASRAVG